MNKKQAWVGAGLAVILLIVGFIAGAVVGRQNNHFYGRDFKMGRNMMYGFGDDDRGYGFGMPMMGGLTTGQITAKTDNSITIKTADGSTKTIYLSGSTVIDKASAGTASDLSVGQNVTVSGAVNSDGTVAATRVGVLPNTATK